MKKKLTALLSAVFIVLLIVSCFSIVTSAGSTAIAYNFSGANKNDKGFAEGTITFTAGASDGGSYTLCWADANAALSGFDPIGTVSVSSSGSASISMPAYTAIPAKATKILAFKGSSLPTNASASAASAVYTIPAAKAPAKSDSDLLYSFAALSDIHMEAEGVVPYDGWSAKYPYDEQHLSAALRTAADRGVDFIITTGDHVNNQRNDKNGSNNNLYAYEWNRYLKILAESDYVNPIYEAIGNHELWNYETDSNKTPRDWKPGSAYFAGVTGLDSTAASLNSGKAYFEITEPVTGDHFLFMALEGGFYTDANNEFSDAQLTWLENKLKAYQNDGKNVFIMEHANFDKWGAGDLRDRNVYDLPLKDVCSASVRLKSILKTYKNAVVITGHTHFKFSLYDQPNMNYTINYSDNDKTSAIIIHNSSVGGVRDIVNGKRDNTLSNRVDMAEGYIVEVYKDATIFYGVNLYYNKAIPSATYMIAQNTSPAAAPTEAPTQAPTQAPTVAPTAAPTEKPTQAPTEAPTEKPTQAPTAAPTEKPTQAPTEAPTEPKVINWGDVDDDGVVTIIDATAIQRHLAGIKMLTKDAAERGMVNGWETLTILDVTCIQRKLAGFIDSFPVEDLASTGAEIVSTGAAAQLAPAAADLSTLRSQAKSALDKYWVLASYDQYQALKKAYKQNADFHTLSAAYNAFDSAVTAFYPGDSVTVRFKAPSNWSSVSAYVYNSDSDKLANWPGKACTKSGDYWYISLPTGKYSYIIFNNNNNGCQTNDLALGVTKNQGYYATGSGSKVNAYPYVY